MNCFQFRPKHALTLSLLLPVSRTPSPHPRRNEDAHLLPLSLRERAKGEGISPSSPSLLPQGEKGTPPPPPPPPPGRGGRGERGRGARAERALLFCWACAGC